MPRRAPSPLSAWGRRAEQKCEWVEVHPGCGVWICRRPISGGIGLSCANRTACDVEVEVAFDQYRNAAVEVKGGGGPCKCVVLGPGEAEDLAVFMALDPNIPIKCAYKARCRVLKHGERSPKRQRAAPATASATLTPTPTSPWKAAAASQASTPYTQPQPSVVPHSDPAAAFPGLPVSLGPAAAPTPGGGASRGHPYTGVGVGGSGGSVWAGGTTDGEGGGGVDWDRPTSPRLAERVAEIKGRVHGWMDAQQSERERRKRSRSRSRSRARAQQREKDKMRKGVEAAASRATEPQPPPGPPPPHPPDHPPPPLPHETNPYYFFPPPPDPPRELLVPTPPEVDLDGMGGDDPAPPTALWAPPPAAWAVGGGSFEQEVGDVGGACTTPAARGSPGVKGRRERDGGRHTPSGEAPIPRTPQGGGAVRQRGDEAGPATSAPGRRGSRTSAAADEARRALDATARGPELQKRTPLAAMTPLTAISPRGGYATPGDAVHSDPVPQRGGVGGTLDAAPDPRPGTPGRGSTPAGAFRSPPPHVDAGAGIGGRRDTASSVGTLPPGAAAAAATPAGAWGYPSTQQATTPPPVHIHPAYASDRSASSSPGGGIRAGRSASASPPPPPANALRSQLMRVPVEPGSKVNVVVERVGGSAVGFRIENAGHLDGQVELDFTNAKNCKLIPMGDKVEGAVITAKALRGAVRNVALAMKKAQGKWDWCHSLSWLPHTGTASEQEHALSEDVVLLKRPARDVSWDFAVRNDSAAAIEITIDFGGSVNLSVFPLANAIYADPRRPLVVQANCPGGGVEVYLCNVGPAVKSQGWSWAYKTSFKETSDLPQALPVVPVRTTMSTLTDQVSLAWLMFDKTQTHVMVHNRNRRPVQVEVTFSRHESYTILPCGNVRKMSDPGVYNIIVDKYSKTPFVVFVFANREATPKVEYSLVTGIADSEMLPGGKLPSATASKLTSNALLTMPGGLGAATPRTDGASSSHTPYIPHGRRGNTPSIANLKATRTAPSVTDSPAPMSLFSGGGTVNMSNANTPRTIERQGSGVGTGTKPPVPKLDLPRTRSQGRRLSASLLDAPLGDGIRRGNAGLSGAFGRGDDAESLDDSAAPLFLDATPRTMLTSVGTPPPPPPRHGD